MFIKKSLLFLFVSTILCSRIVDNNFNFELHDSWIQCNSSYPLLSGFYRGSSNDVIGINAGDCRDPGFSILELSSVIHQSTGGVWWGDWASCPTGYFISGFHRICDDDVACLDYFECRSRPGSTLTYGECYQQTAVLESPYSWAKCLREDKPFYMTAIFRNCDDLSTWPHNHCRVGLFRLDFIKCCTFPSLIEETPEDWICSVNRYGDGVCDCNCGVKDIDCEDDQFAESGCSLPFQRCSSLGKCLPLDWDLQSCEGENYDSGDGCHCSCGDFDPDCEIEFGSYSVDCQPGKTVCNPPTGTCVPYDWNINSCDPSKYGDGVCDCECGYWDIDCNNYEWGRGCDSDSNEICIFQTITGNGKCRSPPPDSWICDRSNFNNSDGCHCNCGAFDLDCLSNGDDPELITFGCDNPSLPFCHEDFQCHSCSMKNLGGRDGCHCGCGEWDIDCYIPDSEVFGCSSESQGCFFPGICEEKTDWFCWPGKFSSNDECDCECGIWDPDCDMMDRDGENAVGCQNGERCVNVDGKGKCIPYNWTQCNNSYYGSNDGCHCNCGTFDPDCNIEDGYHQEIIGCSLNEMCSEVNGNCVPKEPTEKWICDVESFNDHEICNCGCGEFDPDCSCYNSSLHGVGCEEGWVCGYDGTCRVPKEWNCSAIHYGSGDGCHCNCGIWDPDCNSSSLTYGCQSDEICSRPSSETSFGSGVCIRLLNNDVVESDEELMSFLQKNHYLLPILLSVLFSVLFILVCMAACLAVCICCLPVVVSAPGVIAFFSQTSLFISLKGIVDKIKHKSEINGLEDGRRYDIDVKNEEMKELRIEKKGALSELKDENERRNNEIRKLVKTSLEHESTIIQLQVLNDEKDMEIFDHDAKTGALEKTIKKLVSVSRKRGEMLKSRRKEVEELREEVKLSKNKKQLLESKYNKLEIVRNENKGALSQLKIENSRLSDEIRKIDKIILDRDSIISQLKKLNDEKRVEYETKTMELSKTIGKLEGEYREVMKLLALKEEKLGHKKDEVENLRGKNCKLKDEKMFLGGKCSRLESVVKGKMKEIKELKSRVGIPQTRFEKIVEGIEKEEMERINIYMKFGEDYELDFRYRIIDKITEAYFIFPELRQDSIEKTREVEVERLPEYAQTLYSILFVDRGREKPVKLFGDIESENPCCMFENLIVDPSNDPDLVDFLSGMKILYENDWKKSKREMRRKTEINVTDLRVLLGIMKEVSEFFGGLKFDGGFEKFDQKVQAKITELQNKKSGRGNNNVYLGELKNNGVCRHRAIMFKIVCDMLDIPCALVRGWVLPDRKTKYGHLWNVILLKFQLFTVDLMNTITPVEGIDLEHYEAVGRSFSSLYDKKRVDECVIVGKRRKELLKKILGGGGDPKKLEEEEKIIKDLCSIDSDWGGGATAQVKRITFKTDVCACSPYSPKENDQSLPVFEKGQEVAVKIIDVTRIVHENNTNDFEKYIRREASIMKILDHENVVKMISYFTIPKEGKYKDFLPNKHCLCMKFYNCDGLKLKRFLSAIKKKEDSFLKPPSPSSRWESEVIYFLLCASRGLRYLHEMGIVHHDFKPSNILLNWNESLEEVWDVKVADLGGAKELNHELLTTSLIQASRIYCSPEVKEYASMHNSNRRKVIVKEKEETRKKKKKEEEEDEREIDEERIIFDNKEREKLSKETGFQHEEQKAKGSLEMKDRFYNTDENSEKCSKSSSSSTKFQRIFGGEVDVYSFGMVMMDFKSYLKSYPDLVMLMLKCVNKDPKLRPTIDEVVYELKKHMKYVLWYSSKDYPQSQRGNK